MNYSFKDGDVYRNDVKVAVMQDDGTLKAVEGQEKYLLPAKRFAVSGRTPAVIDDETLPPPLKKPEETFLTLRELTEKMQVYVKDKCPPFSKLMGDRTPEVNNWINTHQDIKERILKTYKLK